MNSSTLSSLLFILCLILIFQSPLPTKARSHDHHKPRCVGPDLIHQVCNESGYNHLCQKVLRADNEVVHAKNFTALTQAILKLGWKKAVEGQKFLKELAKKQPQSSAIKECSTSDYDEVIRAFSSSLGEMKNDMPAANYDARIAGDGADYCEKAMLSEDIYNPKIFFLNRKISMLSFVAFSADFHNILGVSNSSLSTALILVFTFAHSVLHMITHISDGKEEL